MSLITPDFGLIFWMVIIFGAVFFLLAKFGFPLITGMVEKRSNHIADSLKAAKDAREELAAFAEEQKQMIAATRQEQGQILKEAARTRDDIIAQAKEDASREAAKIIEHARVEIEAERESALRDLRNQVALLSVEVAEKIVRKNLEGTPDQLALVDRLVDEVAKTQPN